MSELVLRSRRVLREGTLRPASIHIAGGRIEAIGAYDDVGDGPIDDRGEECLLPGIVDAHVHVNEPGRTEWEGFTTATRAAAAGGVTTIVDMPLNSIPATTTVEALRIKAAAMEGKCFVDVALWGGAVPGNASELLPMLDAGARGFKCFLVDSGVEEFQPLDPRRLRDALAILGRAGAPLLVHAELAGPIDDAKARLTGDCSSYRRYLESRPAAAEAEAIALVAALAGDAGAWAHIVHLSAASAVPIVAAAQRDDVRLSAETTPHYLFFEAETIPDGAPQFKCAPPIREHANRERLWSAIRDGIVTSVVSDHSPCTPHLKHLESGDIERAWGGISSLQFSLPVVWTEARKRGFTLADIARLMAEGPAALARIDDRKGALQRGFDADVIAFDPDAAFVVEPAMIEHRHKVTPYEGERLTGVVRATWLRGEKIFENGQHEGEPRGMWIR